MYDYSVIRKNHGRAVSQTIDSPILILDFWELSEAFLAIGVILIFGVIAYDWWTMSALLIVCMGVMPWMRRTHPRGIFLHWPYRHLGMGLPGLINSRGKRKFSD